MSNIYNSNLHGGNPFIKDNDNGQGYDPYNSSQYKNDSNNDKSDNNDDYYLPYQSAGVIERPPASQEVFYQPSLIAWSGRIDRLRFLVYNLVLYVILFKMALIAEASLSLATGILFFATYFIYLIIGFSTAKRRFNDLNKSGWLTLLFFVPIANIAAGLYLLFTPGTPAPNRYGAMPAPVNDILWWFFAVVAFIANIMIFIQLVSIHSENSYSTINSSYLGSSENSQNYKFDEFGDLVSESDSNVVLYATKWCRYCAKTRQFLAENKIEYVEYDIETSEQGAREFRTLHGVGVPLLRIDSALVSGYNPTAILSALEESN